MFNNRNDVFIASATRTAIGKYNGALRAFSAPKLGSIVIEDAIKKANVDPMMVEDVLMGNAISAGLGQNPARQSALLAGLSNSSGAATVNMACNSGLKAVIHATQEIRCNDAEIVVAGGMESMTGAPYILRKNIHQPNNIDILDSIMNDGLCDAYSGSHMGAYGDMIAEKFCITREKIDRFALCSHQRAVKAMKNEAFREEIIPIELSQNCDGPIVFDKDEGPRENTDMVKLSKLKPAFGKNGLITSGSSSQISDGASAIVLISDKKSNELGLKCLARIVGYCTWGVDPQNVMEAPIPTVERLLKKTGLTIDDIDLVEHNEAFASASIVFKEILNIPSEKFNINGGSIALGHPIGASGARILTTLLHAMKDRKATKGLATLCSGGGNGAAIIVETEI